MIEFSSILTAVTAELHPGKVVAEQLGISIIALVVPASPRRLPTAPYRKGATAAMLLRRAFVLIKLLVELLLDILEPRIDFSLRFLEALLELLLYDWEVVVHKAVLSIIIHFIRLQTGLLALANRICWASVGGSGFVCGTLTLVVLRQLAGIGLICLELGLGILRSWRLRGRLLLCVVLNGIGVAHAQQRIKRWVDLSPACDQHGLDHGGVDARESLFQDGLVLLLLGRWPGGLWRRRLLRSSR